MKITKIYYLLLLINLFSCSDFNENLHKNNYSNMEVEKPPIENVASLNKDSQIPPMPDWIDKMSSLAGQKNFTPDLFIEDNGEVIIQLEGEGVQEFMIQIGLQIGEALKILQVLNNKNNSILYFDQATKSLVDETLLFIEEKLRETIDGEVFQGDLDNLDAITYLSNNRLKISDLLIRGRISEGIYRLLTHQGIISIITLDEKKLLGFCVSNKILNFGDNLPIMLDSEYEKKVDLNGIINKLDELVAQIKTSEGVLTEDLRASISDLNELLNTQNLEIPFLCNSILKDHEKCLYSPSQKMKTWLERATALIQNYDKQASSKEEAEPSVRLRRV